MTAFINAIGTAVPDHDVHHEFTIWAEGQLKTDSDRRIFKRMADRSDIDHRWSVLPPVIGAGSLATTGGFYDGQMPTTAARMAAYQQFAPELALAAIHKIMDGHDPATFTHLVVASCTGFVAPGIDQILAKRLGLDIKLERLLIGFMGCYAAIAALRSARHIVRSEPQARVLVVCIELTTLHLQDVHELAPLLAMFQFGDGAAAAIVTSDPYGMEIGKTFALTLPDTGDLIRWDIGDAGFIMHLSGSVPNIIASALADQDIQSAISPDGCEHIGNWAVHGGGRSILDAVQHGLSLEASHLADSRIILRDYGNMSSATLMFVLARKMAHPNTEPGIAIAFGPGLAAEGFHYQAAI